MKVVSSEFMSGGYVGSGSNPAVLDVAQWRRLSVAERTSRIGKRTLPI
jgi:hypothetical protein